MPGLSKIIVIALIAAAIWFGLKAFGRWQNRSNLPNRAGRTKTAKSDVEEMQPCRICGTYLSPALATACGKDNCPYK